MDVDYTALGWWQTSTERANEHLGEPVLIH